MAAPISALQTAQVGLESTRGTLVAASSILDMDSAGIEINRDPNMIRIRNSGSLASSHRSYPGRDTVEITVSGTWSYDWAPWWFNLFLGPLAAGTGAGANKTWTFGSTVVSDVADNLKSASFEIGGVDTWPGEYKIAGCVGQKLSLSIKQDAPWTYSATLIGQTVTVASKTGSLARVSGIKDVLGTGTKAYFDTASSFGTTARVGTVISADIDISLGTSARYTLDATRNAYRMAVTGPRDIKAKIVTEYAAQTDYTAAHAGTAQRLRIEGVGDTLGTGTYKCTIDIPGTWEGPTFGDDSGVITQELNLAAQYDTTPAADINAAVVNASATLP